MGLCDFLNTRNKNVESPKKVPDEVGVPDFEFGVIEGEMLPAQCKCNFPKRLGWQTTPVFYWINAATFGDYSGVISAEVTRAFKQWESVCGLKTLKVLKESDANIRVTMSSIDGRGGTLGVAYQPGNPDAMMDDSFILEPPFVGDVVIDNAERWDSNMLYAVLLHEVGHALGFVHINERSSVMYPTALGVSKFNSADRRQALETYPREVFRTA